MMMRTNMTRITSTTTGALTGSFPSSPSSPSSSSLCWTISCTWESQSSVDKRERETRVVSTAGDRAREGVLTLDMDEGPVSSEPLVRRRVEDLDLTAIQICVCGFQSWHGNLHGAPCHLSSTLHLKHNRENLLLTRFTVYNMIPAVI